MFLYNHFTNKLKKIFLIFRRQCAFKICKIHVMPHSYMSNIRFPTLWYVRPKKAQTSLCVHTVWSEPLLVAWIFYDYKTTDRTSFGVSKLEMGLHRLIWVYTCQKCHVVELHMSRLIYVGTSIQFSIIFVVRVCFIKGGFSMIQITSLMTSNIFLWRFYMFTFITLFYILNWKTKLYENKRTTKKGNLKKNLGSRMFMNGTNQFFQVHINLTEN